MDLKIVRLVLWVVVGIVATTTHGFECFVDDFELGHSQLLVNACPVPNDTVHFITARYDQSGHAAPDPGSGTYLTSPAPPNGIACGRSEVMPFAIGDNATMKYLAYLPSGAKEPQCTFEVIDADTGALDWFRRMSFDNQWREATIMSTKSLARAQLQLLCWFIPEGAYLLVDNIKVNHGPACPPSVTTARPPTTTTMKPDVPKECKVITTTTTVTTKTFKFEGNCASISPCQMFENS